MSKPQPRWRHGAPLPRGRGMRGLDTLTDLELGALYDACQVAAHPGPGKVDGRGGFGGLMRAMGKLGDEFRLRRRRALHRDAVRAVLRERRTGARATPGKALGEMSSMDYYHWTSAVGQERHRLASEATRKKFADPVDKTR